MGLDEGQQAPVEERNAPVRHLKVVAGRAGGGSAAAGGAAEVLCTPDPGRRGQWIKQLVSAPGASFRDKAKPIGQFWTSEIR